MKNLNHLALIMDGNGRWAKQQGKPRLFGHLKGSRQLNTIIQEVVQLKIPFLTLYAFSMENWHRPKEEVNYLMKILVRFLKKETKTMQENNIKLNVIGNISHLPIYAKNEVLKSLEATSQNQGMTLTLALSYGSRQEILQAAKRIALDYKEGKLEFDEINETVFSNYLLTKDLPDPDLIIRTSGEYRLSNFLMWQASYSELYISDKTWPEFTKDDLLEAIVNYQKRERRYGKISEQVELTSGDALEQH